MPIIGPGPVLNFMVVPLDESDDMFDINITWDVSYM